MSEHERETEFLKHCLLYDQRAERHKLHERIMQVQRDERCVQRGVWWMGLLAMVTGAGLCYATLLMPEHPATVAPMTRRLVTQTFCVVGLASLICMLVFRIMVAFYRHELRELREQARRMAVDLLETRLGKPPEAAPFAGTRSLSQTPFQQTDTNHQ
jgi:hypothetical protein